MRTKKERLAISQNRIRMNAKKSRNRKKISRIKMGKNNKSQRKRTIPQKAILNRISSKSRIEKRTPMKRKGW